MEQPKKGRPIERILTDDEKKLVLDMAHDGKTSREIMAAISVDASTFFDMRERDVVFRQEYARARQEGLEQLADDLVNIPDTYADVLRGRLKSENVRWLLSKRKAETYGDRVELNVNHQVDIGSALTEARQRALPPRDLTIEASTQVSGTIKQIAPSATGLKPVDETDDDIFS